MQSKKKKLGLIVNPIAGMGGKVGLKGSDGQKTLNYARELGAKPESNLKTKYALEHLLSLNDDFDLITCSGLMGENVAKDCGVTPIIIGLHNSDTTSEDTIRAANEMKNLDVDDGFTFLFIIPELMIIIDGDDDIGRKVDMRSAERGSC